MGEKEDGTYQKVIQANLTRKQKKERRMIFEPRIGEREREKIDTKQNQMFMSVMKKLSLLLPLSRNNRNCESCVSENPSKRRRRSEK